MSEAQGHPRFKGTRGNLPCGCKQSIGGTPYVRSRAAGLWTGSLSEAECAGDLSTSGRLINKRARGQWRASGRRLAPLTALLAPTVDGWRVRAVQHIARLRLPGTTRTQAGSLSSGVSHSSLTPVNQVIWAPDLFEFRFEKPCRRRAPVSCM